MKSGKKITKIGRTLRQEYFEPLGLTQEEFAERLGGTWSQSKVAQTLNGDRRVTAEDALDFEDALGSEAMVWLKMQMEIDLAKAKESHKKIERIK